MYIHLLDSLRLHSLSSTDVGLVTGLDGGNRSGGTTTFTNQEEQSVRLLLLQLSVDALTRLTRDVFQNVPSQKILHLLGQELTLND